MGGKPAGISEPAMFDTEGGLTFHMISHHLPDPDHIISTSLLHDIRGRFLQTYSHHSTDVTNWGHYQLITENQVAPNPLVYHDSAPWNIAISGASPFSERPISQWSGEILIFWGFPEMGVHLNLFIFMGFSLTNHPFWGAPIYGNQHFTSLKLAAGEDSASQRPTRSVPTRSGCARCPVADHVFPQRMGENQIWSLVYKPWNHSQ